MPEWVMAVERAYVAAAMTSTPVGPPHDPDNDLVARAFAAAGAVASRYLAVGTPRSFGLVVHGYDSCEAAALSLGAHATWFSPKDIRCAGVGSDGLAHSLRGEVVPLEDALAADIVCIHAPVELKPAQLRRGTHINVLAKAKLDPELAKLATIAHEIPDLGKLAAGLVDGRQLDELTIFVIGDGSIAVRAL